MTRFIANAQRDIYTWHNDVRTFAPFSGLGDATFDAVVSRALSAEIVRSELASETDFPIPPAPGARVRLRSDVERGNGWIIPKGSAGTVVISEADETSQLISVRMDEHFPALDSWDNELYWIGEDHFEGGENVGLYAAVPFWNDCALMVSDVNAFEHRSA